MNYSQSLVTRFKYFVLYFLWSKKKEHGEIFSCTISVYEELKREASEIYDWISLGSEITHICIDFVGITWLVYFYISRLIFHSLWEQQSRCNVHPISASFVLVTLELSLLSYGARAVQHRCIVRVIYTTRKRNKIVNPSTDSLVVLHGIYRYSHELEI